MNIKAQQSLKGKSNVASILKGDPGDNGATFTPAVDNAGNLSWTNDAGLENPPSVNIKGPNGYTPVKGTDYWTDADKDEILEEIRAISIPSEDIQQAVDDYLVKNPVKAPVESVNGRTGIVELTAEDVGAISVDGFESAVNDALAQAKASGEFDGKDGTSATHTWEGTVLIVTSASGTSSADLKGEKGERGEKGEEGSPGMDGYSPVRGTDYWTEDDIAQIKSYVDEAILGGAW